MFIGSLPAPAIKILRNYFMDSKPKRLLVGCAGNFTIETTAYSIYKDIEIHSCDVTAYTSIIGQYLSNGVPYQLNIKDRPNFEFIQGYMQTALDQAATILLLSTIMRSDGSRNNLYYASLEDELIVQWKKLHEKARNKLSAMSMRLASYSCEDVMTWVDKFDKDSTIMTFPPFY